MATQEVTLHLGGYTYYPPYFLCLGYSTFIYLQILYSNTPLLFACLAPFILNRLGLLNVIQHLARFIFDLFVTTQDE